MAVDDLQDWADDFLTEAPQRAQRGGRGLAPAPARQPFSTFMPGHVDRALDIAARMMDAANGAGGEEEALRAARATAESEALVEHPSFVQFALKVFVTHHPVGRALRVPSLEVRAPLKVLSTEPATAPALEAFAVEAREEDLAWYREDPKFNEHHDHWHVVYPSGGVPDPADPNTRRVKNRQGELFFYMHQQMLARYDAERIAVGLPRVVPLADYREAIPESYDPRKGLEGYPSQWTELMTPRPAGLQMQDVYIRTDPDDSEQGYVYSVVRHERSRDALTAAANEGRVDGVPAADEGPDAFPSHLGAATEGSIDNPNPARYGSLHNMGHALLGLITDPASHELPRPTGVILDTDTAIRDPVFFRWHKHVDNILAAWQNTQAREDFGTAAPPVRIRAALDGTPTDGGSPDIILSFADQFPASEDLAELEAHAAAAFGGSNWNGGFATGPASTDELVTMTLKRQLSFKKLDEQIPPREIAYLDQKPFFYCIRIENVSDEPVDVTLRVFFVAKEWLEDRRMWMELDKFRHHLQPREQSVAFRRAQDSSIIQKPASKPPGAVVHASPAGGLGADEESYCTCGWPYNLLLPRGTSQGMGFRLLVMATDWNEDQVMMSECGSMSFCGAMDEYPDSKPMGFPFDRPFPSGRGIAETVLQHQTMAARDFRIRHVGDRDGVL